jgi:hypothetical protein
LPDANGTVAVTASGNIALSALGNINFTGILPVANGGTNSSTTLNNNRIMVSSGSAITEAAALTNGQLLIGSTGAAPVAAIITAGSGVSITNGSGSITIAALSAELTGKTNADVNSTFPDNASYFSNVTTANGFPVNGNLNGVRKGTVNTQRIQDQLNGSTYARSWTEGTASWTAWSIYLDANDFTAKGQMHIASANNSVGVLSVGTDGQILTADAASANGVKWSSGQTIVTLASDIVNNNATANTLADVTGLSFPVTAGVNYNFHALIYYTSASVNTGSRWSVNGPAATLLAYTSQYSLTATTVTNNNVAAYDNPALANATSASTTGNITIIDGIIRPSASGTLIVRFASEIGGSAITAKAGSTITWW